VTPRDPLKRREIICEFKKCFCKDYSENKEHYLKAASRRRKPDTRFRYVVLSCSANHQENHIWWIYEQQKHIKKHKKEVQNHDYLKESSRN